MRHLPPSAPNSNVLVGLDNADDAGVYKINDDTALVQTLDYFTPIVDDPYTFGQIAAANALSDVYAMGAKPITALNIVGFPINKLDKGMLTDILSGASDKVAESGAVLIGGHSVDDEEPKYGLSITGTIHPDRIISNTGAQPGDQIILTKPIGVGILTSAIKQGLLTAHDLEEVTSVMSELNKTAAEVMEAHTVHACTDVTGFGLLGHTLEMAENSNVGITISSLDVPILERAKSLAEKNVIPGGTKKNHRWISNRVTYDHSINDIEQLILCDAVTSGGLLMSVPEPEVELLKNELRTNDVHATIIGEVSRDQPGHITVK